MLELSARQSALESEAAAREAAALKIALERSFVGVSAPAAARRAAPPEYDAVAPADAELMRLLSALGLASEAPRFAASKIVGAKGLAQLTEADLVKIGLPQPARNRAPLELP